MTMQRYFIHPDLLVGCAADDGNVCMFADVERLKTSHQRLLEALLLAEHKIDQHLQGQYPDDKALGAALQTVRLAIAQATKEAQG